jgi:hypothetical protein
MKNIIKLIIGCVAAGIILPASAQITLSLSPSSQTNVVGGMEAYNLVVSGLKGSADYNGPALGGFDVQLDFNSTIASAQSVTFGSMLNLSGNDFQYSDLTSTPGQITLAEISYDSAAALEGAQTKSFTLATIDFQGLALGSTTLTIDPGSSLSDENGNTLDVVSLNNGSLTVAAVPEPSTCALGSMALMLLGLRAWVRIRNAKV